MDGTRVNRLGAFGAVLGLIMALLMWGPTVGPASAAVAGPAGDAISVGDPYALGQIDLFVDPMCPFSGKLLREKGADLSKRIEDGSIRVNVHFVKFLEKYSASGTYDVRAISAAYAVAAQSKTSEVTWRFIERIFSEELQPKEGGPTDLDNDQLAEVAGQVGAPPAAQDQIRMGVPFGHDTPAIAERNLDALHAFPSPGVPLVVIGGQPVDLDSDWLAQFPEWS